MSEYKVKDMRRALIDLFKVLDTREADRPKLDKYMDDSLAGFPYVNGGLFSDENIEIPNFTEEIRSLLLEKACAFKWADISPTIFGAVFESTLNPETRRKGGMHYTSIENIHKVIDPLFLNDLKDKLKQLKEIRAKNLREKRLVEFQHELATLKFLDPACGSGNFLTQSYIELRKIENEIIFECNKDQISLNPIEVSIGQFYGIEINDFAVSVAKTALWIAESQMMKKTEELVNFNFEFLPLKSYPNIVEGNALRIDWKSVVPKTELNYIMGNPPFVGYSLQTKEQKNDIISIYVDEIGKPYKTAGKIDYVSGWYFKAAELMQNTDIRTAFVSTNSITQGEQVAGVWKPLYERFDIHIDFAYRTFKWDNRGLDKNGNKKQTDEYMAAVHCVIIGFSAVLNKGKKIIYFSGMPHISTNINPYLCNAPNIFIDNRKTPICKVSEMLKGSIPVDDGNFFFTTSEKEDFIKKEPKAEKYIKRFYGAKEFLHNEERWCLWLLDVPPNELKSMPYVMDRIKKIMEFRLNSTKDATKKYAAYSFRFMEIRQPKSNYILIPSHSSENRKYVPIGFETPDIICGNANLLIPNASIYEFGVLTSNVHMAWMRVVGGRLKSDYRYSGGVVYNNFPWCSPTPEQKAKIEQTAQAILDARALYPDCSLADLYDELTMPSELRKAHQQNDIAVMKAYGFTKDTEAYKSESACVAELMKMYLKIIQEY